MRVFATSTLSNSTQLDRPIMNPVTFAGANATISWQAVAGADDYKVEISPRTAAACSSWVTSAIVSSSVISHTETVPSQGEWCWRVFALKTAPAEDSSDEGGPVFGRFDGAGPGGDPVPVEITGITTAPGVVTLNWTADSAAATYDVERTTLASSSCNTGSWSTAASGLPGNTIMFADNSVAADSGYCYRVRARNSSNLPAPWSNEHLVTSAPAGSLNAPANLAAGSPTFTSLALSWNDLPGESSYEVWYAMMLPLEGTCANWQKYSTLPAGTLSEPVLGLLMGKGYCFTVRGVAAQAGAFAPIVLESTMNLDPPDLVVASTSAINGSESQIILEWHTVPGAIQFEIDSAPVSSNSCGSFTPVAGSPFSSATLTTTQAGLSHNQTRCYRIRSVNGGLFSDFGDVLIVTAAPGNAIAAPTQLTSGTVTETSVALSWNSVGGASGYEVWRASTINGRCGPWTRSVAMGNTPTNYTVTGLTQDQEYCFTVRGTTAADMGGPFSDVLREMVVPGGGSSPGGQLSAPMLSPPTTASTTVATVTLDWTAVANSDGYRVERADLSTSSCGTWGLVSNIAPGVTTFSDSSVAASADYCYRVAAVDSNAVIGPFSNDALVTAHPHSNIPAPATLSATGSGSSDVDLTWSNVAGEAGFEVWRANRVDGTRCIGWMYAVSSGVDVLTAKVTGLSNGQNYCFTVRGWWAAMQGGAFSPVVFASPGGGGSGGGGGGGGGGDPTIPTILAVTQEYPGSDKVIMTWTWITGATSYEIQRASLVSPTGCAESGTTETTPATLWTMSGITINQDWCFRVRPVIGGTPGTWSPPWHHRQMGSGFAPLSAPDPVWLTSVTSTGATVNWSPVSGADGYELWRGNISTLGQCIAWTRVQAAISSAATSWVESALSVSPLQCWMVRAFGTNGPGHFSRPVRKDNLQTTVKAPEVVRIDVMPAMAVAFLSPPSPMIKAYETWIAPLDPVNGCGTWSAGPVRDADMRQVIMIDSLSPQARYCFKLRGIMRTGGVTESSPIVIFATPSSDTTNAPQINADITGIDAEMSSLTVYTSPTAAVGQVAFIETWGAEFTGGKCNDWVRKAANAVTSPSTVVTALNLNTTYCVSALAVDISGLSSGDFSTPKIVSTRVAAGQGTAPPSFVFQHPTGNDDIADESWVTELRFATLDSDSVASIAFFAKPSSTTPCHMGGAVPLTGKYTLSTETLSGGVFKFDRGMIPFPGQVWFCAVIDDGVNPPVEVISGTYQNLTPNACTWRGQTSDWGDPINWIGCNGTAPMPTDRVVIYPIGLAVPNSPSLDYPTTIAGFAPTSTAWIASPFVSFAHHPGNNTYGQLTLNQMNNSTPLIAGMVSIQAHSTCTGDQCRLTLNQLAMSYVPTIYGGQLHLSGRVRVDAGDRAIVVGNAQKAGALLVNGYMSLASTSEILTWPTITSSDGGGFRGIIVDGSPFSPSMLQLMRGAILQVGPTVDFAAVTLRDNFIVGGLSEVFFQSMAVAPDPFPEAAISIGGDLCAYNGRIIPGSFGNGLYFDGDWTKNIVSPPVSCGPAWLPPLTITQLNGPTFNSSALSGGGDSWGESFEQDDMNVVGWSP